MTDRRALTRPVSAPGLLLLLLLALLACKPDTRPELPAAQAATLEDIGPIQPLPARMHRGFCYAHSWEQGGVRGYGSAASQESKRELLAMGVDWISITPFGFQSGLDSTEIQLARHGVGESDARIMREVSQARALGIKVMLKPHIWIGYDAWQGHIQPEGGDAGWSRWFESYTTFILHYAELAQRLKIDALAIGTELASSTMHMREPWVALIARIRAVYTGPITYAANWNEAEGVKFWDKVDWIGVQFYPPLTDHTDASYDELHRTASRWLDTYGAISARHNDKPVLLTEVGYKSIKATAIAPATWPEHLTEADKSYDERNQALAFRALNNAVAERDFMMGYHVWKWFTYPDTDEEGNVGYAPRHRLAQKVLTRAFGGGSGPPAP